MNFSWFDAKTEASKCLNLAEILGDILKINDEIGIWNCCMLGHEMPLSWKNLVKNGCHRSDRGRGV